MPYLKLDVNNHRDSSSVTKVQIALLNNGVGPAFIQNTKIHYQDSIYELGLVEFIYSLIPLDSVVYTSTYPLRSGDVVPAGREWVMLETSDQKLLAIISRLAEEVELTITYTSIYDEAWQITNEGTPKKLD